MKKDRNLLTNSDDGNEARPANALKVLIVGDSEKVDDSKELLDSLTMIGYHIASLGDGHSIRRQDQMSERLALWKLLCWKR